MILRKIHQHFLPHFYLDIASVDLLSGGGHIPRDRVHHRAHAISLEALFRYLVVLVVTFTLLYFIQARVPQVLGTVSFSAGQIVDLTNQKRAENGLPVLSYNPLLSQAAASKAADMFANDYWAHYSPSGKSPWSFIAAVGYRYIFAGENLARDFNDPVSVVNAWMNSPSHRSNLLDKNFKEIGVAVESGNLGGIEGSLVVQIFGTSISQIPQAPVVQNQTGASPQGAPTAGKVVSPVSGGIEPSLSPSPSASGSPSPTVAFQAPPVVAAPSQQTTVLATRQFAIARAVSIFVIGFIFLIFALEVIVSARRANVHIRSGLIAHLGLLGFVLLAVWYAVAGAII